MAVTEPLHLKSFYLDGPLLIIASLPVSFVADLVHSSSLQPLRSFQKEKAPLIRNNRVWDRRGNMFAGMREPGQRKRSVLRSLHIITKIDNKRVKPKSKE